MKTLSQRAQEDEEARAAGEELSVFAPEKTLSQRAQEDEEARAAEEDKGFGYGFGQHQRQLEQKGWSASGSALRGLAGLAKKIGEGQTFTEMGPEAMEVAKKLKLQDHPLFKAGDWVEEKGEELYPVDQEYAEQNPTSMAVAGAVGSSVPYFASAVLGGGPAAAIGAGIGISGQAGESIDNAIAKGATPEQISDVIGLGGAIGLTEQMSADFIVNRLLKSVPGGKIASKILDPFIKVATGFLVEGGQEVLQGFLQNALSKHTYDPKQEYSEGWWENFLLGGTIGGGVAAIGQVGEGFEKRDAKKRRKALIEEFKKRQQEAQEIETGEAVPEGSLPPEATGWRGDEAADPEVAEPTGTAEEAPVPEGWDASKPQSTSPVMEGEPEAAAEQEDKDPDEIEIFQDEDLSAFDGMSEEEFLALEPDEIRAIQEQHIKERDEQGDGTRAKPVKVEKPGDMEPAREQVEEEPTPEQAETGEYDKGHATVLGDMGFTLETKKGGTRKKTDRETGETLWEVKDFPADYGEIKGTLGADGDPLDAYVGENPESPTVWVVDQSDPNTGEFDEHKPLLHFPDKQTALETYAKGFTDGTGPDRIGNVAEFTVAEFKEWSKGDTTQAIKETDDAGSSTDSTNKPVAEESETPARSPQESSGTSENRPTESSTAGDKPSTTGTVEESAETQEAKPETVIAPVDEDGAPTGPTVRINEVGKDGLTEKERKERGEQERKEITRLISDLEADLVELQRVSSVPPVALNKAKKMGFPFKTRRQAIRWLTDLQNTKKKEDEVQDYLDGKTPEPPAVEDTPEKPSTPEPVDEKPEETQEVKEPDPVTPPKKSQIKREPIGKNSKGEDVYQDDDNSPRYVREDGVKVEEPIELKPVRDENGGIRYEGTRAGTDPRFDVVDEKPSTPEPVTEKPEENQGSQEPDPVMGGIEAPTYPQPRPEPEAKPFKGSIPFINDNPGNRHGWLDEKQAKANRDMADSSPNTLGKAGLHGSVTRSFKGVYPWLDAAEVSKIPGVMGEHPAPGGAKYDRLMEQLKKEKQLDAILIGVNHLGQPFIIEGNNRAAVARDLGIPVKTEVRWFNGGEEATTGFTAEYLESLIRDEPDAPAKPLSEINVTLKVDVAGKPGEQAVIRVTADAALETVDSRIEALAKLKECLLK